MILLAFSVRDEAVEAFLPPVFVRAKGEAIRSFQSATMNDQLISKNLNQYVLYEVGKFDDTSGILKPIEPVRHLSALEAKALLDSPSGTA